MTPDEYCQQKAAASGSSFYYAFRFLPRGRRQAMTALYAFCREVDDVVDETEEHQVAHARLAWWREEIARLFAGKPEHPVTRALAPHVQTHALPQDSFLDIIAGMEMDLKFVRYQTFQDLQYYCHRVAGVVGELSARIFGFTDPATLRYADQLGLAMQLSNIIRDVGEDARRGRIYLPIDELQQFAVPAADLLACCQTPAVATLMEFQIERAERLYLAAWQTLPPADRKSQRPGLLMAAIYRSMLAEIRLEGASKVLQQRLSLTPLRKLWLAWKTWTFGYQP